MRWERYSTAVMQAARKMDLDEFRAAMGALDYPYGAQLLTPWEDKFYESMLEHLALLDYLFSSRQMREIFKMREKYDLDIQHREATR